MLFFVIDDDAAICTLVTHVLNRVPEAEIREFGQAETAMLALEASIAGQDELPALLITDIGLPGVSGLGFCHWVKQQPALAEVPIIVISGVEGDAALRDVFDAGAHDFIRKPIHVHELEIRLKAALRLSVNTTVRRAAMERAETELQFNQAITASISNMGVGLMIIDRRRLVFANPALCQLTGYSASELYAWPHYRPLFHLDEQSRIDSNHERRLRGEDVETRYETALQCKNGLRIDVEFSVSLWQTGGHDGVICLVRDIREELQMRRRLRDIAEHDALTGLPNRRLMQDRLNQALLRCSRNGGELAVLFVDLDGFKAVNDTLGHAAGDELLRQVAERLQKGLRASDTAARLAGDEFVLILHSDVGGEIDPAAVAIKILQQIRQPFTLETGRAFVTASIGIVKSRGEPDTVESILHRADLAMYQVKQHGKDAYRMIDEGQSAG